MVHLFTVSLKEAIKKLGAFQLPRESAWVLKVDVVRDNFDYVWKMLEQDHVRRASRQEVWERLKSWLTPPAS